jgi:signal peptidase I
MSNWDATLLYAEGSVAGAAAVSAPNTRRPWLKKETRLGHTLICVVLWSIIAFLTIKTFVFSSVIVSGVSMWPTLHPGDSYFVNRLTPRFAPYQRGDLVVIRDDSHDELIVKRIIGLPNDLVEIKAGRVYVNGAVLEEPYVPRRTRTFAPPKAREMVVPADSYFVLGDNRPLSEDSRWFGAVPRATLLGTLVRGS